MIALKATKDHCKYCFDTLNEKLDSAAPNAIPKFGEEEEAPVFVTWNKREGGTNNYELRGCIGTFETGKLNKHLKRYALFAALEDSRFSPVTRGEMKDLKVSVSLLVNFEDNKKPHDWEVGKHGIIVEFEKGRRYSATYLPEIASEQSWTKEEALQNLIRKAGYRGTLAEVADKISLTTYESSKMSLTHEHWKAM